MLENKMSFVFRYESAKNLIQNFNSDTSYKKIAQLIINDYYLSPELRVRHNISKLSENESNTWELISKKGTKVSGCRIEENSNINDKSANILVDISKLHVKKSRTIYEKNNCTIHVDLYRKPMNIAMVEVERVTDFPLVFTVEEAKEILNLSFVPKICHFSTWQFFNRKIGICGSPSSGKTEVAKRVSNILNTKYGANSFYVSEYATSFLQKYNKKPSFYDQFLIWYGQQKREADAMSKSNFVISDCPTFLSYIYALRLTNECDIAENAIYLSKIYKQILFELPSYSHIIFLQLKKYKQNNIRFHNPLESLNIQSQIEDFLINHNIACLKCTYNEIDSIIKYILCMNE